MGNILIKKCNPYYPISIKNILIIKLDHIGDFILAIPAIELLRQHFNDAKFFGLISEWNKDLAELTSIFDEIIFYNFFLKERSLPPESNEKKELLLEERLNKYQFDIAIDLRRQPETRKFLKLSGAKIKAGYKTGTSDDSFLDISLESYPDKAYARTTLNETHSSLQSIALAMKVIELFLPSNYFRLNLPHEEIEKAKNKLEELGINFFIKPLIGIHPGATHPAKQWGVENFNNLIKAILASINAQIAILGGKEDLKICQQIVKQINKDQKLIFLTGIFSIREFIASATFFDLIIGNDNGALHCASAAGTPTIAIFGGRETPWEWAPFNPRSLCIFHEVSCSPCHLDHRSKCPYNFKCIQNISVSDVMKAVNLYFSESNYHTSANYYFVKANSQENFTIKTSATSFGKFYILSKTNIIIAASGIVAHDAIGNDCVEQYRILKEVGKKVYLYAENIDPIYKEKSLKDFSILDSSNALLIYHHGNFWKNGYKLINGFKGNIIIKYHNITPPYFFEPYSSEIANNSLKGIQQTKDLLNSDRLKLILCDSQFNAFDIEKYSLKSIPIKIVPPLNKIHELETLSININLINKLLDQKINILFVGRISPHKGLKHLIHVAFIHKQLFDDNFRFIIVGGYDSRLISYFYELKSIVEKKGLSKNFLFVGRANNSDLKSFYLASHIFLILSEHEGFCIPILESQYFKVPIIAYKSTAIPDTLGKNQIIFDHLNYEQYSKAIYTIVNNEQIKLFLIENGQKNYSKYEYKKLRQAFLEAIENFL